MRQRVLGAHPALPQSRTAMKFRTAQEHRRRVNEAYDYYYRDIQRHFASGGGYRTWVYDAKRKLGEGYTNQGTRTAPLVLYVPFATKVAIAFAPATNRRGYRLDTAYPEYP